MQLTEEELELIYKHHPWYYDSGTVGYELFEKLSNHFHKRKDDL